jgi:hypothetical protein
MLQNMDDGLVRSNKPVLAPLSPLPKEPLEISVLFSLNVLLPSEVVPEVTEPMRRLVGGSAGAHTGRGSEGPRANIL